MRHCFDTESIIRRQAANGGDVDERNRRHYHQQQQHHPRVWHHHTRQQSQSPPPGTLGGSANRRTDDGWRGQREDGGDRRNYYQTLVVDGGTRWRQHHDLPVEVIRMTVMRQWSKPVPGTAFTQNYANDNIPNGSIHQLLYRTPLFGIPVPTTSTRVSVLKQLATDEVVVLGAVFFTLTHAPP
ncbi:hypothetical protein quinque_006896 [Culex quinquefasciatus]